MQPDLFGDVAPLRAKPAPTRLAVHHSSETPEHYTPAPIIEAARRCLGGIDLDPASCATANAVVQAACYFSEHQDGLHLPWAGRVWLNPPYGRGIIDKWVEKALTEYRRERIEAALLLVPARPGSAWWAALGECPMCMLNGRIGFLDATGAPQAPAPFPSAVFYLGTRLPDFLAAFWDLGQIRPPMYQRAQAGGDPTA